MAFVPKTYERNLRNPMYYSTADVGGTGYNPEVIVYYGSDNKIVRVKEVWRDEARAQTISGSNYAQNWPSYTYTETYSSWESTTVS